MIANGVWATPWKMRALLGLKDHEPLPPLPVVRDGREWREEPNGQWRLYTHTYTTADRAEQEAAHG